MFVCVCVCVFVCVCVCVCVYSLELGDLVRVSRKHLHLFSKAKAAKLVRELVEYFLDMEASTGMEVELRECEHKHTNTHTHHSVQNNCITPHSDMYHVSCRWSCVRSA